MDRDVLEVSLARGESLDRIARRFAVHPSTVAYWIKKHGLSAAHAERHAARGGIARERLEALIEAGGTHRSLAAELGVSVATVRHWLERYGLETRRTARRRKASKHREARQDGMYGVCERHGPTRFVLRDGGTYRCARCRVEAVARRRRQVRAKIVQEAGGACACCGYDAYLGALQFHHVDPSEKEFGLSGRGITRSLERLREEAKKCVLLCANCHAEVEGGYRTLSLKLLKPWRRIPSNPA